MPIIATAGNGESTERALHPSGLTNAVCADVHDLGLETTEYMGESKTQHKILIVWETEHDHPDFGGPFRVNRKYTLSLYEMANLCKDLESWRGRGFTEDEKQGFDVEKLIGVPATLNIVHNTGKDGRVWANVKAVLPHQKNNPVLTVSDGFVRMKDRPDETGGDGQKGAPAQAQTPAQTPPPDGTYTFEPDDDLPF